MIILKPLKNKSTNRDKRKYIPWSVVRKHNIISLRQQARQIFKCVNNKLSQTCVSIILVFCILYKVVQQCLIRPIQHILQEGFLLIQENLKMTVVSLLTNDFLVKQVGIFKVLVHLTLHLSDFFKPLVKFIMALRERNFQLFSITLFFF